MPSFRWIVVPAGLPARGRKSRRDGWMSQVTCMRLVATPMQAKPRSAVADQQMGGRSIRLWPEPGQIRGLNGRRRTSAGAANTIEGEKMAAAEQCP